jgi:hypothetical protein
VAKKVLAITGIVLFSVGIGLALVLLSSAVRAFSLDMGGSSQGVTSAASCQHPLEGVSTARRVISESDSESLSVVLGNDTPGECEISVHLSAPNFDISPTDDDRTVNVPPAQSVTIVWILSPRKSGSFQVAVTAGLDSAVVGLTVTDVLGLTPQQAKILSMFATFLGPILTAPWWYDRLKEARTKKTAQKAQSAEERTN